MRGIRVQSQVALCWICRQEPGTTGEHRNKRSDIVDQLGSKGPLYLHTDKRRNLKIQSSNSQYLKFQPSICNSCNSARTQPHDLAWQGLSTALRTATPALKTGDIIDGANVFPNETTAQLLNVHLFFVKWLGYQIVESGCLTDPPIETFSDALMNQQPYANLWLAFGTADRDDDWVGASDLDAHSLNGGARNDYLCRFYEVGTLEVRVRFSSIKLKDDWLPSLGNSFVVADLIP